MCLQFCVKQKNLHFFALNFGAENKNRTFNIFSVCLFLVPEDPADALNRTKCLEYLAALRHTKWFQVNEAHFFSLWPKPNQSLTLAEIKMQNNKI